KRLLMDLGIEINEIIPEGGNVTNLKNLPKAHFNIVPYREVGLMTAMYLKNEFQMPYISTTPMGILNTAQFIHEIENLLKSQIFNSRLSSPTSNQFSAQLANADYQNHTNHTSLLDSQQQQVGTTQYNKTRSTDSESKTHKLITEIF